MKRFTFTALFPLFAVFCAALPASAAAATPPAPTVTGGIPPLIGATLTATPAVPGDSIDWETCDPNGTPTVLATGTLTYTLAPTDGGHEVCAFEMDPTGLIVVGVSDPIGPVEPSLNAAGAPVTEGDTLTVTQGAWGGGAVTDVWEDCTSGGGCAPVASGATGTTYVVARSDVGSTIAVQETGTLTGQPPETTAPTGVVSATPPVITSPPTVSGAAVVGDTLTASPGSWTNLPTSYRYQWERCSSGTCIAISHATSSTYVPVNADVGDTLEALVTGVVDGVAGNAYPSYPTNPVVGISVSPTPTPQPSSPPPPVVVPVPNPRTSHVLGRLTATMRWSFSYAPAYTEILALAVDGPARRSTIETECRGRGCPFRTRSVYVPRRGRCRSATKRGCPAPRIVNLESGFARRRLGVGVRVTVMITRAHDIGKYYRFVVRARRAPSVRISCLAPGSTAPGKGCWGQ